MIVPQAKPSLTEKKSMPLGSQIGGDAYGRMSNNLYRDNQSSSLEKLRA